MGFQVIQKLSSREKAKKCDECLQLLQEEGKLPDLQLLRQTLLEAHSLTQTLANDLRSQEQINEATARLASHIEELLTSIKA